MKKFQHLSLFCCFVLIFACSEVPPSNQANNDRFNVLFIIADDLNCDLGSYGNNLVQTPNIDKLAERGMLFQNAHNQYPLCGPSRASFMTGMYTDQTKMTQNNVFIRSAVPDAITLGQRYRQQGYQSVRIGKIFHYDNPSTIGTSGMDDIYSWDQTINPYGRDKKEEYKINTLSPRRYGGTLSWLSSEGDDVEQTDGIAASEAVEQLEGFAKSGDNFFLALGFFRPHTPFVAPKKYFDLYNRDSIRVPQSSDAYLTTLPVPAAKSIRAKKNQLYLSDTLAQEIKEAYYATISFVDAQVGKVLDKLEATGLDNNTIVVFTSDHGYHMGEHGHWQKQTLFENSTRIPLILSVPGVHDHSERTMAPVELIDVYPTLMDLTDIIAPSHVVGKSLVPLILHEKESVRGSALTRWRNGYSMKTKRYRITKWGNEGQLGYELYDHIYDQEELNNLVSDTTYNQVLDSLKIAINLRIDQARVKPKGLGRQLENAKQLPKAKNITYGDLFDESGKKYKNKE